MWIRFFIVSLTLCVFAFPVDAKREGIRVEGDEDCFKETNEALELLATKTPSYFQMVQRHVSVVECREKGSGVAPWHRPVRVVIGDETRGAGKIWYASVLVHESCHVVQYRNHEKTNPEGKYGQKYMGKEAEASCLGPQKDVLEILGAEDSTLDYIDTVLETEYWDVPYEERWW